MGVIVAIGGDQNNRNGHLYETEIIDRKIVNLTNKENPNFLFIGIANEDYEAEAYNTLKSMYLELGCNCDCLLTKDVNNEGIVSSKINSADIIYLGGGNTVTLIERIRNTSLYDCLKDAYNRDCVLCGSSAGAIAYFTEGHSDYNKEVAGKYCTVAALGYIEAMFCPHYTTENRKDSLKSFVKHSDLVAIGLDNNAALIINGEYCELIASSNSANGYRCFSKDNEYYKEVIVKNYKYKIKDLINKKMLNY